MKIIFIDGFKLEIVGFLVDEGGNLLFEVEVFDKVMGGLLLEVSSFGCFSGKVG